LLESNAEGLTDTNQRKPKVRKPNNLNTLFRTCMLHKYASLNDGGYVLRNASLGDFVVMRKFTYTNLDSTV